MSVSITIATVLETGFDQLSGKVASSLPKKKKLHHKTANNASQ